MKTLSDLQKEAHDAVNTGRILFHKDYESGEWPAICYSTLAARGQDATIYTDQELLALESTLDLPGLSVDHSRRRGMVGLH
jgi:hypothetical protein